MSELVYVNYLKELNNNLLSHSCNLNLDFEIGSSHVPEQLNVLEQYLVVNNLALQGENSDGINNLIGFVELSEDLWHKRFVTGKQHELKEIQKRNHLFKKGKPRDIVVVHFDSDEINEIDEELPEFDIDLFDEEQEIIENNEDINEGSEEEIEPEEEFEDDTNTPLLTEDFEDDTNTPLLTDVFNDLQKAQILFDEEDDDYQDEYAIIEDDEEPEEEYPEDIYEQNMEPYESPIDNVSNSSSDFTFEQPQTEQRDRVLTDAVVDKANAVINKGINALLKKIAK